MKAIEKEAVAKQGISIYELMKRAGGAVAKEALEVLGKSGQVLVFCGSGNNGGDGFIAARLLAAQQFDVEVIMLTAADELTGAAQRAFKTIEKLSSVKKTSFSLEERPYNADLVIDAVLGFGLKGNLRGNAAKAISLINSVNASILSVDIPSGVNSDTGQIHGDAVKATRTVTFTCPKAGMAIYPGANFVGSIRVADIGIEKTIISSHAKVCLGSRAMSRRLLPNRQTDAHKGDCGRVLVIGGSVGMTGAVAMSSQAALKIGAGLVTLGVPESLNSILETKLTEVMTKPLPDTPDKTLRA
ncbi:MAG: NAD(P)H-hydrate epimerase, partial [Actinomycetia bacterium]|nr:NAD(P)H-hydrate epimerase [Actinomycetes bacterium]